MRGFNNTYQHQVSTGLGAKHCYLYTCNHLCVLVISIEPEVIITILNSKLWENKMYWQNTVLYPVRI